MIRAVYVLFVIVCIFRSVDLRLTGGLCDGKEYGTLLPCPTDCNRYIVCLDNTEVLMNCPSHLVFNPQSENCDYSENVKPPKDYCPWPDQYYYDRHFCDCNKFIICNYTIPLEFDCDAHYASDQCRVNCT